MSDAARPAVRLIDEADRSGRTTATMLASLSGRLAVLPAISGADAVGSLIAGFAELGRQTARTAEGAELRRALASGRAGSNGERVWSALLVDRWTASLPPSPVLDHLRNDLALLLAADLDEVLELPPAPAEPTGSTTAPEPAATTAIDVMVGLWTFGHELVAAVDALAGPTRAQPGRVEVTDLRRPPPTDGVLLR
jgi:hypothetical protein